MSSPNNDPKMSSMQVRRSLGAKLPQQPKKAGKKPKKKRSGKPRPDYEKYRIRH